MILFENPPTVYFEKVEDYEEKSTPWRRVPPTYKGSSTKKMDVTRKQIRKRPENENKEKDKLCHKKSINSQNCIGSSLMSNLETCWTNAINCMMAKVWNCLYRCE